MTQEQLKYVREWARSGNKPRQRSGVPDDIEHYLCCTHISGLCAMSMAGLLIARLADALEQANETAESGQWCLMMDTTGRPHEQLTTMRTNRMELLGR
jgi:hypothetical protein